MNRKRISITLLTPCLAASVMAQQAATPSDLANLSIDDLMKIEVTSASKRAQPLDSVAAALTVITQEDIQRSGARTLVDALRLVPGLQIGRYTQNYYGVTVRGFNSPNFDGSNGNKLLVLLDGRSLYMPYSSSVYWEIEDTLLEDVDRIEVIRGPGGSLYGANAVNGVINIITKPATATLGGLLVGSVGTLQQDRASGQYGWKAGEHAAFRVYAKHGNDNPSVNTDGSSVGDTKVLNELGFRGDIDLQSHGNLMIQGAYHRFNITEAVTAPTLTDPYSMSYNNADNITTSDLLGLWTFDGLDGSKTKLQVYYDRQDYPYTNASGKTSTWDFDLQRQFPTNRFGTLILGAGYRTMVNGSDPGPSQQLNPATRHDAIYSLMGQQQVQIGARDTLTAGIKLEQNTYTGFEFEPSIRYLHKIDDDHSIWGAVSRAVRTPSQTELSDQVVTSVTPPSEGGMPTASTSFGNPNLTSEHLVAYEMGYRLHAGDRFSLDLTGFYDRYSNLIYSTSGANYNATEFGVPVTVAPTYLANGDSGDVYGGELEARWKLGARTFFTLGGSYIQQTNFSQGTSILSPRYQAFGRLSHDFNKDFKADAMYYWYDSIPSAGQPSYSKLDLHVSWKVHPNTELSLGGQDLLFGRSVQFPGGDAIPRSVYLQVNIHF